MTGSLSQTRGRPEPGWMPPGRELDALIAEKVMGWTDVVDDFLALDGSSRWFVPSGIDPSDGKRREFPHYSTDINAAFTVVERITQEGDGLVIEFMVRRSAYTRRCTAQFHGLTRKLFATASADRVPHAICLAALAALSPADDGGAR